MRVPRMLSEEPIIDHDGDPVICVDCRRAGRGDVLAHCIIYMTREGIPHIGRCRDCELEMWRAAEAAVAERRDVRRVMPANEVIEVHRALDNTVAFRRIVHRDMASIEKWGIKTEYREISA